MTSVFAALPCRVLAVESDPSVSCLFYNPKEIGIDKAATPSHETGPAARRFMDYTDDACEGAHAITFPKLEGGSKDSSALSASAGALLARFIEPTSVECPNI